MKFKRTDTISVKKNYIHINKDYCLFHALPYGDYCVNQCEKHKDFPDCECEVEKFLEFAEKKLGMCTYK